MFFYFNSVYLCLVVVLLQGCCDWWFALFTFCFGLLVLVLRGACGFSDGLVYVCLGFDIWFWFCGVACVGVLWIVVLSVFRQLGAVYFVV